MTAFLSQAWEFVEAGDARKAIAHVRRHAADLELPDTARLMSRIAADFGFADLARAADAVAASPRDVRALYDFGFACVDRGVPAIAVPALETAARLAPGAAAVRVELVVAYERTGRHRDAVAALRRVRGELSDWPERYLLVHNAVLAGDLGTARAELARLRRPDDPAWLPSYDRLARTLARADLAAAASPLDGTDLRGWTFVLGGTLLGTLSPYGFDAGMNGRYAFLQDDHGSCLLGLRRLRAVLEATGRRPASVSPLPERGARILGLAAAEVLGLPVTAFAPDRPDTLVVAYDLNDVDDEVVSALQDRPRGQILHEHATCWTGAPLVAADFSALQHQVIVPPWGEVMRVTGTPGTADAGVTRTGPDTRPEAEIAAAVAGAEPADPTGDGGTPLDGEDVVTAFAAAVAARWATGPRHRARAEGPVGSSRFQD